MNTSLMPTANAQALYEIKIRTIIGIFVFLVWKLSEAMMPQDTDGVTQLVAYSLLNIIAIISISLSSSGKQIARDVSELYCYSTIFHLGYIPLYLNGVQPTVHSYANQALLILFVVRLIYFRKDPDSEDFKGFPTFGLIGLFRKWQESNHITNQAFNHVPSLLFFGSAAPLIFITARSNDSTVTTTVAGLMLFVYFIASTINKQQIAADTAHTAAANKVIENSPTDDTTLLREIFNDESRAKQAYVTISTVIRAIQAMQSESDAATQCTEDEIKQSIANFDAHYYYPLGRLMQLLPGDITNVDSLTPEQGNMCRAVSEYAAQAHKTISDGLEAIDALAGKLYERELGNLMPDLNEFMDYLESEAEFMECNKNDYGSAAICIRREIP